MASLTVNMKAAISLLIVLLAAIIIAFTITIMSTSGLIRILAVIVVIPQIILDIVFIYYCRRMKAWSYVGASILGALGVVLRILVSTQPGLEVGGGLPFGVTAFYIVLGSLVSLKSYEAFLELNS